MNFSSGIRKGLVGLLVIGLALGAARLATFLWIAVPAGTGMAAKHLCSCVFVSGLDPDRVMEIAVNPVIWPLGWFARFETDPTEQTATVTSFGFLTARAAHRPGLGCTLLHGSTASELRAEFTPPADTTRDSASEAWTINHQHRAASFYEEALDRAIDTAFVEPREDGPRQTLAVVVVHDGQLVAERYATGVDASTPLMGWSMTKSVTCSLVGVLVRQGRLVVEAPAAIEVWSGPEDPRHSITLDHLLRMTSGLDIVEDQSGADANSRMQFLERDGAAFAASRKLRAPVGSEWEYTSGNTMLVSRIVRDAVGGGLRDAHAFAWRELFEPIGMATAVLEPDRAGTFVGSSYMFASARDWARFGLLYLNDGVWEGRRILPEGWVDYVTSPTPAAPQGEYGAGFWVNRGDPADPKRRLWPSLPRDAFAAQGFQGQYAFVVPSHRLVVVRLGVTRGGVQSGAEQLAADVIAALRPA
jgi:CubicO group peptidase (beta-lactamase class C family)